MLGQDELVAEWVRRRIPHMQAHGQSFGPCVTIGVINANADMLGGVVFHSYRSAFRSIEWSAAAASANWLSPRIVSDIMSYPFGKLDCKRITATIARRNKRAREFHTRFGFRQEGLIRNGFGSQDACIYGLLASEWRRSPFNVKREVGVRAQAAEAALGVSP